MPNDRRNPQSSGGRSAPGGAPRAPQPVRYFDNDGKVRETLFNQEAQQIAEDLQDVNPTQLRRFYGDVLQLRRRLDHEVANKGGSREQVFARLRPEFKLLRAKAFYAKGRKTITGALLAFLDQHVTSVGDFKEFDVFCKHFQAVVAFHKYYEGGRR